MTASDQTPDPFRPPVVSVIVTAYNRGHLLPRAFESLAGQTLRDFEIIVVDDASTDDTAVIVSSWADQRICYLRHEHNRGAAHAYNTGIRAARGQFITCLDSDDTVRPNWLERQVAAFRADSRVGMVWGWIRVHEVGKEESALMYRNPFGKGERRLIPKMLEWTPGTGAMMVRREVYDEIGLIDPNVGHMLDVDLAARFALSRKWTVAIVPEVLVDITQHGSNMSGNITPEHLQQLKAYVSKHGPTLAMFPAVEARYMYRIGRVSEQLGMEDADRYLRRSIELAPRNVRYRGYPIARDTGMLGAWNRLSKLRIDLRGWYRNMRHGDSTHQAS